jgi:hypothetical protein
MARPKSERPLVELVHDESAINTNDDQSGQWQMEGELGKLRSKSKGKGLMVSAFISEIHGGVLTDPSGRRAAETLEYGQGLWWNSPKMLAHLDRTMDIAEAAFPWARCILRYTINLQSG